MSARSSPATVSRILASCPGGSKPPGESGRRLPSDRGSQPRFERWAETKWFRTNELNGIRTAMKRSAQRPVRRDTASRFSFTRPTAPARPTVQPSSPELSIASHRPFAHQLPKVVCYFASLAIGWSSPAFAEQKEGAPPSAPWSVHTEAGFAGLTGFAALSGEYRLW